MSDHARYDELAALAAGGCLSDDESRELSEHLAGCLECRKNAQELRRLVHWGLPLTREFSSSVKEVQPDADARRRFLARARTEGLRFSPSVERPERTSWFPLRFRPAMAVAVAAVVLIAILYGPRVSRRLSPRSAAEHEVDSLKAVNASLGTQLAARDQELANLQKQLRDLHGQLGNALKAAESYRRDSEQKGVSLGQSTSETAQLLEESQNREKQLQASNEEIARINQLRATDKVSLEAQRIRIREISDQLRIADATLEMERQLSAAGKDIRELLVARQLHVVDVRDMDENGKPGQAFGRVFLTEGKSLMFFAFDLNDPRVISAKARFQVWGEQRGKKGSAHSLGVLSVDDETQNRWALKVENSGLLSDVNSVYVTASSPGGKNSRRRMLYAFLGEPNHS